MSLGRRLARLPAAIVSMVRACSTAAVFATLAVCSGLAVGISAVPVGQARGATIVTYNAGAPGSVPASHGKPSPQRAPRGRSGPSAPSPKGVPHAPSGPALASGGLVGEEASASAPSSGGDPLTGNGLDSPLCRRPGGLSAAQQRSCQTDDFVAAPDPTNNYAFDVNIDTGATKWGNDMSATIDNFAQFGWMALVSATHGLVVMSEWCYSLDLLSDSLLRQVKDGLRNARLTFTEPWLVVVLAIASTLAVYHGLVRRQVAETMGQVLAMLAMMVGGLWVIADPGGTVGAVERWADQTGLGTMAAVASGTPGHAERTLADNMQMIFSSVVSTPWCYLEFGNVGWCDSAPRLDGGLKSAGLAIAKSEAAKSGCRSTCAAGAGPGARTLAASAALLREAHTNGELFLALPANEVERNSVTREGMLLNVLCGGGKSADACRGPTGAQAEFRSQKGTGSRVIGLFAIWLGALGMLLLLGFLVLRLLGAALVGLFLLLLAPAAVLAPALGDGGRSAFRAWALKLMEAVIAKLTYSFLLGVVLMMMRLLLSLSILGWWEQWLLISAFWWGVFLKRHETLGWAQGGARGQHPGEHRSIARRVGGRLETPRALLRPVRAMRDKRRGPGPEVTPRSVSGVKPHQKIVSRADGELPGGGISDADGPRGNGEDGRGGGSGTDGRVARERKRSPGGERAGLKLGRRRSRDSAGEQAAGHAALAGDGAGRAEDGRQLERVRREREKAVANGDTRRAAKLGAREQRIEGRQPRRETLALAMIEPELELGELAVGAVARRHMGGGGAQNRRVEGASLAGGDSHGASPAGGAAHGRLAPGASARERHRAPDAKVQDQASSTPGTWQAGEPGGARERARRSSSVMDDAREVAARRKRQLGWGPAQSGRGPEGSGGEPGHSGGGPGRSGRGRQS